jgi:hypothetical protein
MLLMFQPEFSSPLPALVQMCGWRLGLLLTIQWRAASIEPNKEGRDKPWRSYVGYKPWR